MGRDRTGIRLTVRTRASGRRRPHRRLKTADSRSSKRAATPTAVGFLRAVSSSSTTTRSSNSINDTAEATLLSDLGACARGRHAASADRPKGPANRIMPTRDESRCHGPAGRGVLRGLKRGCPRPGERSAGDPTRATPVLATTIAPQVSSERVRRCSRRGGWLRRSIWRASWGSSRLAWRFSR